MVRGFTTIFTVGEPHDRAVGEEGPFSDRRRVHAEAGKLSR